MYSTQAVNGLGVTDGSNTINPAALSGVLANSSNISSDSTPRGLKRIRSPEISGDSQQGDSWEDGGDSKSRKRGRAMKQTRPGVAESPNQIPMPLPQQQQQQHHQQQQHLIPTPQTPQSQTAHIPPPLSNVTPTQSSQPKATPTKTVIKALPTVRDHTTDQLGAEGDEYVPREYDDAGEKKVTNLGHLTEGRDYKCRTFFVPNRGDKLFMLATECARVLGYRDSYLLFNKNRSLYKIIATQAEKEDLIHQDILPFSYRSRQIAIVTAKSMFRQFGSRVIVNGRRVRDDYWETKARKQGFTEEDMAGEKRPGAAKARESAAAEANANASLALGHHGDIVYSNNPGHFPSHPQGPQPQAVQPGMMGAPGMTQLPMITLAPEQTDVRLRDYSNIQRPRQEITGAAYVDRTQTSPPTDLLSGAHQAADYNKQVNAQRTRSTDYLDQRWRRPQETSPGVPQQPAGTNDGLPSAQALQSPRTAQSGVQQSLVPQSNSQHMVAAQTYSQPTHQPNPIAQSPMRSANPGPMRPDQMGRPPGLPMGTSNLSQGGNPYAFAPQTQMWPPSQPQQSPQGYPNYAPQPSQQSPHLQQSAHQPPQIRHSSSNPQMQPALQYPGMQGLGQGYPAPGRGLYQQDQGPQQFMQPTTSGPQPGAQGWAPQQPPGSATSWGWNGQGQ